jgi:hypothetical protein
MKKMNPMTEKKTHRSHRNHRERFLIVVRSSGFVVINPSLYTSRLSGAGVSVI